jgi:methionyl aminopeptidase
MNRKYKENFIKAGSLAKHIRSYGKSLIIKEASYNEIIAKIILEIKSHGAIPAFPPQIALNEVAAHFLPSPDEDIMLVDQVVKLDIGVCYEGAIGDTACTVDLSGKNTQLITAAEMALENACNSIKVGMKVCEIGKIIDTTIKSYGLHPVRNLAGHGLGIYKVHMPPTIPNYDDRSTAIIKPGMTFAIEPFATDGEGYIYEVDPARIYAFTANKNAKSVEAKNLLIKIKALKGLPFSLHEILDENFTLELTIKGIDELMKIGAIDGYGPLIEETGGMVAQFEHSVLVDDEGNVIITTR